VGLQDLRVETEMQEDSANESGDDHWDGWGWEEAFDGGHLILVELVEDESDEESLECEDGETSHEVLCLLSQCVVIYYPILLQKANVCQTIIVII
jgi:hypothetical protein